MQVNTLLHQQTEQVDLAMKQVGFNLNLSVSKSLDYYRMVFLLELLCRLHHGI